MNLRIQIKTFKLQTIIKKKRKQEVKGDREEKEFVINCQIFRLRLVPVSGHVLSWAAKTQEEEKKERLRKRKRVLIRQGKQSRSMFIIGNKQKEYEKMVQESNIILAKSVI